MKKNIFAIFTICIFSLSCSRNPVTGKKEFVLMTESQEIELGRENYGPMIQQFNAVYQQDEINNYVSSVGQHLSEVSHRPQLPYEFTVVNSSVLNAFALPGGKICITRGLLSKMKNESELAAVLGHEIGHVTAKHTAKRYTSGMIWQVLLGATDFVLSRQSSPGRGYQKYRGLYTTAAYLGLGIGFASYGRSQETQSDDLGQEYMVAAGYNPEGMVKLQGILLEAQKTQPNFISDLFASHPHSKNRVERSTQNIKEKYQDDIDSKKLILNTKKFSQTVVAKLDKEKPAYEKYDRATEYASNNNFRSAIALYREALTLKPTEALFYADLGFAYMKLYEDDKAEEEFNKSLELHPSFFKAQFFMGQLNYESHNYGKAMRYLEEADRLIPKIPFVRYMLAYTYETTGRFHEAVSLYRQIVETYPDQEIGQKSRKRLQILAPPGRLVQP
ncbi:MAG: M48 family metalloprotease [Deltaproteobacteria bacterium]|nr:M48 family metalloprotease [Deltaproteobacteria bacterium]